jgi:site-specific recombinase XerD
VQGTLAGEHVRKSLGLAYWDPAAELILRWELTGRFDVWHPRGASAPREAVGKGEAVMAGSAGEADEVKSGMDRAGAAETAQKIAAGTVRVRLVTAIPQEVDRAKEARANSAEASFAASSIPIVDGVARFMASLATENLSHETTRKYRTVLERRFVDWCESQGLTWIAELGVLRMDEFRATWTDSPNYALKNLERLRTFFGFCVDRGWIAQNSAKAVRAPKVDLNPTLPFTEDEMTRILDACGRYRGNRDKMRAFVLVMRYSGLRISDTVKLHADQRQGANLLLRTTKTGQGVFVPLPQIVIAALEKIERPGGRYFTTGNAKLNTDTANWSAALTTLFELAEVQEGRSHRFRDTFSTSLLTQGVSVENVAILLGNTPAIVMKHYAPWILERQRALTAAVRTMWPSEKEGAADASV